MKSGYNLLEILVVLIIISLIVGLVGTQVFRRLDGARVQTAQIQIRQLQAALDDFRLDVGRYPSAEEGLEALLTRPSDRFAAQRWNGPYLNDALPLDPWGTPYQYAPAGAAFGKPVLYSYGADGEAGGAGDAADVGQLPEAGDAAR